MHAHIKAKIIQQLDEVETLLFPHHRDSIDTREFNELGYAWMSVKQARDAMQGRLPGDPAPVVSQSEQGHKSV
jgi:hypothetical protein